MFIQSVDLLVLYKPIVYSVINSWVNNIWSISLFFFLSNIILLSLSVKFNINYGKVEIFHCKEVNNYEEGIYYIFFFLFLTLYIFISLYFNILFFKNNLIYISMYVVFTILFIIPINYLYTLGFNFISYIRGAAASLIFTYEFILDLSNLLSMFLRILLQFIRLIIIWVTLYTFNSLWIEVLFLGDNLLQNTTNLLIFLNKYILIIIYYLFEIIHFFIIFIMQITAFLVMTFWLFQFLYTTLITGSLEK